MKNTVLGIKILTLVFAFCIILSGCSNTVKTSADLKATDKFFVNDFADVISDTDEQTIYNKGVYLNDNTSAQVVVVTVDTVGDEDISDYALNLGRNWGIGDKEKDNGIVILLAVEDRNVEIQVGYGLEGALNDSKVGRILDNYGVPYFSEDNFSEGLVSVYNAVYNEVLIEYGLSPDENYVSIEKLENQEDTDSGKVVISWIVLLVIVFVYLFIFKGRGFFFIGGPPFGGGHYRGGFGGSSGGFSGGFRGGGGSFGGGGAGRRF